MTLDVAIEFSKYKASQQYSEIEGYEYDAEEHKQLAEWLEELKEYRENIGILIGKEKGKAYKQGRNDERKEWETSIGSLLIKYEGDIYTALPKQVEQIRTDAIEELKSKKDEIIRWLIKRDKEGYGTTNGELLDHILEIAEQMKDSKK